MVVKVDLKQCVIKLTQGQLKQESSCFADKLSVDHAAAGFSYHEYVMQMSKLNDMFHTITIHC